VEVGTRKLINKIKKISGIAKIVLIIVDMFCPVCKETLRVAKNSTSMSPCCSYLRYVTDECFFSVEDVLRPIQNPICCFRKINHV